MVGIYFSGTGNTRYCTEQFVKNYDDTASAISIEAVSAIHAIKENELIVFAYPVYYSNIPKIVRDFIEENHKLFMNKKIYIIATMGLFSGDGTGCSARILRKYGADVIGGLHLRMPDCIADEKILKYSIDKNKKIVLAAEEKIKIAVKALKDGNPSHEGLSLMSRFTGFVSQRLWFSHKTKQYSDHLKIKELKCISCGKCCKECPMNNLELVSGKVMAKGYCTMCYRCINSCPKQAITLLGIKVHAQSKIERYL